MIKFINKQGVLLKIILGFTSIINLIKSDVIHVNKIPTLKTFVYGYTYVRKDNDTDTNKRADFLRNSDLEMLELDYEKVNYEKRETYLYLDSFQESKHTNDANLLTFRQLLGYPSEDLDLGNRSTGVRTSHRNIRTFNDQSIILSHFKPNNEHKYGATFEENSGIGHSNEVMISYSEKGNLGKTILQFKNSHKHRPTTYRYLNDIKPKSWRKSNYETFTNKYKDRNYPFNICELCGQRFRSESFGKSNFLNETCEVNVEDAENLDHLQVKRKIKGNKTVSIRYKCLFNPKDKYEINFPEEFRKDILKGWL